MKDSLLWIAGSGLLVLTVTIGVGAYFFLAQNREPGNEQQSPNGTYFPVGGSVSGGPTSEQTRSLALATGETIVVNDFLVNGVTFKDPANEGSYFLAGKLEYCLEDGTCPDTHTPHFSILYMEADQSFTVSLNEEPLRESREAAEQYLMKALGISTQEMCALSYTLGTTVSVNEAYGSITNLGFSFCQGAVRLP